MRERSSWSLTTRRLGESYNVGGRTERSNLERRRDDLRHARREGAACRTAAAAAS